MTFLAIADCLEAAFNSAIADVLRFVAAEFAKHDRSALAAAESALVLASCSDVWTLEILFSSAGNFATNEAMMASELELLWLSEFLNTVNCST